VFHGRMTRREMLGAAAGGLVAAQQPRRQGRAPRMTPIIDTHQHLWDLDKVRPPWLPASGPLAGAHTMERYLREAEGLGIERTVYMEVDVAPEDHVREAETVLAMCRQPGNPMVGAVIGGRPASEGFGGYIRRFGGNRHVRGVRQVLHGAGTPRGYCLQERFVRSMRLLGEMGLAFDICVPAAGLPDAARLCDLCPDTRFILDHCGNPGVQTPDLDPWRRDMAEVAKRPNIVCKISGIVATAREAWKADDLAPIVHHCAEVFGRDRIVFASDWPVCTLRASLRQWVLALREIVAGWSEQDQRKLFHDNAIRAYRLPARAKATT